MFRRAHPAFAKGEIEFVYTEGDVVAFVRNYGNESVLCVFNLGAENQIFQSGLKVESLTGHGFNSERAGDTIRLKPYSAFFGRIL
nr:alpha-glucosidase AglA [uncultured bacterium]